MTRRAIAMLMLTAFASAVADAFESDVHFGLTRWLALEAGFTPAQAQAIAIGDNRVDSGDMQYLNPLFVYACVGIDDGTAKVVSLHHYPTRGAVPGAPEQRSVSPGSDAAYRAIGEVMKAPVTQSGLRLYLLGEALHILQDSWAHQGVPEAPSMAAGAFSCDPAHAWGHAHARGGASSHKADHTRDWPADTIAMAKATYDALTSYPPIMDAQRAPKKWDEIRPALDTFAKAGTKAEKKAWFASQGIADVAFLGDTTLRDGNERFDIRWPERKLPALPAMESRQHNVDGELLAFYSRFFAEWMTGDDLDRVAQTYGVANAMPSAAAAFAPIDRRELAARLKLWRMRDHGAAADLAHAAARLSAKQIAATAALAKGAGVYARYSAPMEAFFPMMPLGDEPSPLLPFIVEELKTQGGAPRAVATAKFRHAPYDLVGAVTENVDGQWRIVAIESAVDH